MQQKLQEKHQKKYEEWSMNGDNKKKGMHLMTYCSYNTWDLGNSGVMRL